MTTSGHAPADRLPAPFTDVDLSDLSVDGHQLADRRDGKVRVSYAIDTDRRLFATTDRISAFDRVIGAIPYKGQVLNQLAAWWFAQTATIVPNHVLAVPDPNVTIARATRPLPVEVIVRGAITGSTSTSLWTRYAAGARHIDGYTLPDGLRAHTLLDSPLVTPTTKPAAGTDAHDEPLSCAEVVARGLVAPKVWNETVSAAVALFRLGQRRAAEAGLVLADTKYEFGLDTDGSLRLIDEVHTPDSSRYWVGSTYEDRLAAGKEPESLDKEPFRLALAATGYRGDGPPPPLDDDTVATTSARYVDAFERVTGTAFQPGAYPVADRIRAMLSSTPHPDPSRR